MNTTENAKSYLERYKRKQLLLSDENTQETIDESIFYQAVEEAKIEGRSEYETKEIVEELTKLDPELKPIFLRIKNFLFGWIEDVFGKEY